VGKDATENLTPIFHRKIKLVSRQEPPVAYQTEPISWIVCPSHLLFHQIELSMRRRKRHVDRRASAGVLIRSLYRVLDDRLLIPADWTYCIFIPSSAHSVRLNTVSGEFKVFGRKKGWTPALSIGVTGCRSNWQDWNEQWSKTHASTSTNINANRLLRTCECLVKQT